jgi:hypothetical protein
MKTSPRAIVYFVSHIVYSAIVPWRCLFSQREITMMRTVCVLLKNRHDTLTEKFAEPGVHRSARIRRDFVPGIWINAEHSHWHIRHTPDTLLLHTRNLFRMKNKSRDISFLISLDIARTSYCLQARSDIQERNASSFNLSTRDAIDNGVDLADYVKHSISDLALPCLISWCYVHRVTIQVRCSFRYFHALIRIISLSPSKSRLKDAKKLSRLAMTR